MKQSFFKTLTASVLTGLLVLNLTVSPILAVDIPQAPSIPVAPTTPDSTTVSIPSAPPVPESPQKKEDKPASSPAPASSPIAPVPTPPTTEALLAQQKTDVEKAQEENKAPKPVEANTTASPAPTTNNSAIGAPVQGEVSGDKNSSSGKGDPFITTGDANAAASLVNTANTNAVAQPPASDDITVGNTGNGSGSANSGEVNTSNSSDTIQTNNADVDNALNLQAVSGDNQASKNMGDANIVSGNSNTTASVVNGINTNVDGIAVVEFNVDDTHQGDIILAMPTSTGCTATVCNSNGPQTTVANTDNGSGSTNTGTVNTTNDQLTFQNNSADVVNDLVLVSDSGNNETNANTGGDNMIQTGDANVVATVANAVNNNIAGAGKVMIAVVNIFGDLVGDIILPESSLANNGGTTVANTGNGSGSVNNGTVNSANTNTTVQNNQADIANNLSVLANTGENQMSGNTAGFTGGENVIETGDATLDVNAITIANNNVAGDEGWWLVFVNDASGNWTGQIMGAPAGATMAGTSGSEFDVLADGTIVVKNADNGAGSVNNGSVNTNQNTTVIQNNQANITNNLTLVANTGENQANNNTGGSNSIKTGDANIMANIVNFVNNNFEGNVVVSFVNVFGSWIGSFVPPGMQAPLAAIGGEAANTAAVQNSSSNMGSNSTSQSNDNPQNTSTTVAAISVDVPSAGVLAAQVLGESSDTNNVGTSGKREHTIVEDDSITVPASTQVAGVSTIIPSWFWKVFAASIFLLLGKKMYNGMKKYSARPVTA